MFPALRPRFGITNKILISVLGLSLISLIAFTYIGLNNMSRLGKYTLGSNAALGARAISDSTNALEDQAEEYLIQTVADQAAISNSLFEKVSAETEIVARYASSVWSNPVPVTDRQPYSQEERPDDIYSASVYVLAPSVTLDEVKEELARSSSLDSIFISVFANDKNLNLIYIGTESGIAEIYPWSSGIDPVFDPRARGWYTRAKQTGTIGWSDPYIDAVTGRIMVTCSKPVYDSVGKLIGVVGADVSTDTISQKVATTQIGESGYAILVDANGRVVARPGLSSGDKRWDESFETENLLSSDNLELRKIVEKMIAGETGISTCTFEGTDKYIAYALVGSTGWSLGIVMSIDEIIAPVSVTKSQIVSAAEGTKANINRRIGNMRNTFIWIFAAMILAVSGTAFTLSRRITRPILSLNRGAKIVGGGNLDYQLQVKTGDEIEDLANAFSKMTKDLKVHISQLQETTAAKERIESELRIANEIQTSMLPRIFPPFPQRKEFDIYATMNPAKEVGGDFYDFFFINEDELCVVIGDVCGKGVPAALFMAISKTLLKTEAQRGFSPDEVLFRVNNTLYPDNDSSMFFTGFCTVLNTATGEIRLANGGHNPPLICASDRDFEFMGITKGFVVGAMPDTKFESRKLFLKPDDVIFMYTDGVTEAMNAGGQLFSEERLKSSLAKFKEKRIEDIIHGVRAEIDAFTQGTPQSDDITMLALKFKGKAA